MRARKWRLAESYKWVKDKRPSITIQAGKYTVVCVSGHAIYTEGRALLTARHISPQACLIMCGIAQDVVVFSPSRLVIVMLSISQLPCMRVRIL
jgi:hypothetical protein